MYGVRLNERGGPSTDSSHPPAGGRQVECRKCSNCHSIVLSAPWAGWSDSMTGRPQPAPAGLLQGGEPLG